MAQATGIDESQFVGTVPKSNPTAVTIRRRPRGESLPVGDAKLIPAAPAIGIRVRKNVGPVCRPGCSCKCHSGRKSHTSGYLDGVVGRLFLGYSGLPWLNSSCDSATCQTSQAPSVSAEYWFPMGFCWSQIIRLQISYQSRIGPQWELTSLRRVPDSAHCVKFALEGDIKGLKGLFQHGMASPKDVSNTRGYSLLRVSCHVALHPFLMLNTTSVGSLRTAIRNLSFPYCRRCRPGLQVSYPVQVQ